MAVEWGWVGGPTRFPRTRKTEEITMGFGIIVGIVIVCGMVYGGYRLYMKMKG
jgi:hypothetical protein